MISRPCGILKNPKLLETEQIGGYQRWGLEEVDKMGEGDQKVQTSSYNQVIEM